MPDAMPPCLQPVWDALLQHENVAELSLALRAAIPDDHARAEALFRWLGSVDAQCGDLPASDKFAHALLDEVDGEDLVEVADSLTVESALRGAVQYFLGGEFAKAGGKGRLARLPVKLQKELLRTAEGMADTEWAKRARRYLPASKPPAGPCC